MANYRLRVASLPTTGIPNWVPATVGAAALVPMTNTADNVLTSGSYSQGGNNFNIGDYSGGRYAPNYGSLGAMIVHGGGHAATQRNDVITADFNDLAWKVDGAPTDLSAVGKFVDYVDDTGGIYTTSYDYFIRRGPNSTGWLESNNGNSSLFEFPTTWGDPTVNPCEIVQDEPGSAHTYDSMFILPPSMGGGSKGSLIRVMGFAVGATTSSSSGFAHRFDLDAKTWERYSTNGCAWASACGVAFDSAAGRAWVVNTGTNTGALSYLDTGTKTWGSVTGSSGVVDDGYIDNVIACWHAAKSIAIHATTSNPPGSSARFYWFSTTSSQGTRSEVTWTNGTAPPHFSYGSGTLCDIPEFGKVFYYAASDLDAYYLFTVPANPANQWTWERVAITGTVPSALSPAPRLVIYHRMDYAPQLRSVMWVLSQANGPQFGGRVLCIRVAP